MAGIEGCSGALRSETFMVVMTVPSDRKFKDENIYELIPQ
jgi:hypothetical protein